METKPISEAIKEFKDNEKKILEAKIKGSFGKFGFLSSKPEKMSKDDIDKLMFKLNDSILSNSDDVIDDLLDKLDDDRFRVSLDKDDKLMIAWPTKASKHKNLVDFYTKLISKQL